MTNSALNPYALTVYYHLIYKIIIYFRLRRYNDYRNIDVGDSGRTRKFLRGITSEITGSPAE